MNLKLKKKLITSLQDSGKRRILMNRILIDNYEFIKVDLGGSEAIFSTGENGLDFNKNTEEGINNIENIKSWFNIKEVGFLNQIHSDNVFIYEGKIEGGDALITNQTDKAIGVFTADCVPILLYDKKNNIIASIHSGWRGTFSCILLKTIDKMKNTYGTKEEDLIACIGPHMRQCCYEVSYELIDKFRNSEVYKNVDISDGRMLSMTKCINHQLIIAGVKAENIKDLNICTFCSKEYKLHSYRKNTKYGRMFSFIYLKSV
jgi:YfiH family protein